MFIIRPAKIKDLPEIIAMRLELAKYHEALDKNFIINRPAARKFYNKLFKDFIRSRKKKLLVAEADGKSIGFASAFIAKSEPFQKIKNYGHIRDAYVDKKFRRLGVGKKFIEIFYEWFKKEKLKYIDLNVFCANKLGRAAWGKYGFKDYSIRKRKIIK